MKIREEYWTLARYIKYIGVKFRISGTTFVTQQKTDVSTLEITDKIPLEKVIIAENFKGCHHTERACPLIHDPRLYSDIGAFVEVPQVEVIIYGTHICPDDTDPPVKIS